MEPLLGVYAISANASTSFGGVVVELGVSINIDKAEIWSDESVANEDVSWGETSVRAFENRSWACPKDANC